MSAANRQELDELEEQLVIVREKRDYAVETLRRIANHDLHVEYADCALRNIARRALAKLDLS